MGITLAKKVDITSAHFRWGWQISPDAINWDQPVGRYYLFSAAHDRIEAQAKSNQFLQQVAPIFNSTEPIMGRTRAGLFYFRQIVDSPISTKEIDFKELGRYVLQDRRFCERKSGDIFHYLDTIYHLIEQ